MCPSNLPTLPSCATYTRRKSECPWTWGLLRLAMPNTAAFPGVPAFLISQVGVHEKNLNVLWLPFTYPVVVNPKSWNAQARTLNQNSKPETFILNSKAGRSKGRNCRAVCRVAQWCESSSAGRETPGLQRLAGCEWGMQKWQRKWKLLRIFLGLQIIEGGFMPPFPANSQGLGLRGFCVARVLGSRSGDNVS